MYSGCIPVSIDILIRRASGTLNSFLHSFSIFVGMLFGPLALLFLRDLILTSTSWGVTAVRENKSAGGSPKYCL